MKEGWKDGQVLNKQLIKGDEGILLKGEARSNRKYRNQMIYKIYKKKDFAKIRMFLNSNSNNDGVIFKKNVLSRIRLHTNNIRHFLWK